MIDQAIARSSACDASATAKNKGDRAPRKPKREDLENAHFSFMRAVRWLAETNGPDRDRLRVVFRLIASVVERELPEIARGDLRALYVRTSWAEDKGKGTRAATLALISDKEARRLVRLVVDIHEKIVEVLTPRRRVRRLGVLR